MNAPIVFSDEPVLLVGGAIGDNQQLHGLLEEVKTVVAADSGADWLMALGRVPDAVIGDLDSISPGTRSTVPQDRLHHIAEQESTDFDKALRSIDAPLVIGTGFLGGRVDHLMAAMTVLARRPDRKVILLGAEDVLCHLPPTLSLDLEENTRVSLYPMQTVAGSSSGLHWPIDGLAMSPSARVGTSNRATGPVTLSMDGPGMLLILPVSERASLQRALTQARDLWPAL